MSGRVLYLGWVGYRNFGDEWLWQIFEKLAKERLPAGPSEIVPSVPGVDVKDLSAYDTIVLGGGSLLIAGYADIAAQALRLNKRVIVWGSGYDCIHLPKSSGGGIVRPDSVAESDKHRRVLREIAEGAAFFAVRGPWTAEYLVHQGVPANKVTVSGDPGLLEGGGSKGREGALVIGLDSASDAGFALGPDPGPDAGFAGQSDPGSGPRFSSDSAPNTYADAASREFEAPIIGINWGTVYNRIYGSDEAKVENALAALCRRWIGQGFKLLLYVVWGPDREASKRLYEKIGSPDRVEYDPTIHDAEGYLRLVRRCSLTVNLKLHANVMSAAAGVLFVSLGYRFKCFDFAHSLGLPELVVPTNAADPESALEDAARYALGHADSIGVKFAAARERAARILTQPFERHLL